jgi:hypothetical protein
MTDDAIWIIHHFRQPLKWKKNNIRITYKYMKYKFKKRLICEFATYMYLKERKKQ